MTPLGKSLIAFSAIGIVVAGTMMLRPRPEPVARGRLTPSQVAEIQPQPKAEAPKPTAPVTQSAPPPEPEDPEFEDGSGS
jgi:hypothetical protein